MKLDFRELDAVAGKYPVLKLSQVACVATVALGHDGEVLAAKRTAPGWKQREAGRSEKTGKSWARARYLQIGSNFGGEDLFCTPDGHKATVGSKIQVTDRKVGTPTAGSSTVQNPDDWDTD